MGRTGGGAADPAAGGGSAAPAAGGTAGGRTSGGAAFAALGMALGFKPGRASDAAAAAASGRRPMMHPVDMDANEILKVRYIQKIFS